MIFINGSFANNKDLSSQISYIIILVNEASNDNSIFSLKGNIVYWSLTKCKCVIRSVLVLKIYGIVNGFDISILIAATFK